MDGVFHLAGIVKHSRDNGNGATVETAWKVNVDGTFGASLPQLDFSGLSFVSGVASFSVRILMRCSELS